MAEGERIGANFTIDTTNLKAGLQQANRLIRESNSEFKAAAAGLDDWTKSEEGLTAKLKNLNEVADLQAKSVEALQKEYDKCIENGLDPMSSAAIKMRTDINKAKADLAKTQSETKKYEQALDELRNSTKEASDELEDLGEAAEKTGDELEDFGEAAEEASDELEDLGEAAEKAGDGFTVGKGAIASFIGNGLSNLVGACKNAISSIMGLAEATSEYRENMAKLDTAFSVTGHSQADAQKAYEDFYAILGESDRSVEAVNHLAELTNNQEELSKWSTIAAGVTAKFGDSLPIEGLTEAANETAKVGKVTGVIADALTWAGESEDEFNAKLEACNNEQERSKLITDTLNGLYEEAAEKYNEQTKSQQDARRATAELEKAQAELGSAIEPITTKFTELKAKGMTWLIDEGLPAVKKGFEWIIDNKAPIIVALSAIVAGLIAFNVTSIITGVTSALSTMKTAVLGVNAAMKANPIGLVITAVGLLVAAFMYLWKNCESFRNFWIGLWDGVKKVVSVCVEWIKANWKTMLLFLVNPLAGTFKYLYDHFEGFRNFVDGIVKSVKNFFTGLWSSMKNGAKDAWTGIKKVFSNVTSWFKDKFTQAWTAVKNVFSTGGKIFSGIKEGIETTFKTVVNGIISGINKIISVPFKSINSMLNKIRNTSFLGISPFKKLWGENPLTVPVIPQLAKGGVVDKATLAMIGEKGKEAVVPLERNTEWIDKVAEKVASKQPKSVVVNQTNNYAQAHTRYELYKSKQQTAAAVRLALKGV